MHRTTSLALRAVFVLGFLAALSVMAVPGVARWIDETLYGKPNASLPPLQPEQNLLQIVQPQVAERSSPASYDAPVGSSEFSRRAASPLDGLDALAAAPPPMAPLPDFSRGPLSAPAAEPAAPAVESPEGVPQETTVAQETIVSQVQKIRDRLEVLGAQYILLETADGSGKFRFHCRMLLDEKSAETRDFEATAADPANAAQTVLQEVELWRTAAIPAATRTE